MSTEVKFRRDTTANLALVTPAVGEIGVDLDRDAPIVGDGATAGGIQVPNAHEVRDNAFVAANASGPDSVGLYTVTLVPAPLAYVNYLTVIMEVSGNSIGNDTLDVNGLGPKNIKKEGGATNIAANDLVSGGVYVFLYDGVAFQVQGSIASTVFEWQLLERQVPSAVATVEFNDFDQASFDALKLVISGLEVSANREIWVRASTDNGGTWKLASGDYALAVDGFDEGANVLDAGASNTTAFELNSGQDLSASAGRELSGEFIFWNHNETSDLRYATWQIALSIVTSENIGIMNGAGRFDITGADVDALQVLLSGAGNISADAISLFGLRKS